MYSLCLEWLWAYAKESTVKCTSHGGTRTAYILETKTAAHTASHT